MPTWSCEDIDRQRDIRAQSVMNPSGLDEIDFDYATSVAQKAQGLMAQHRVPPTPDNFAVWFKYALGTSAQLNMAMNVLIGNKRKFDPATNRDLYRAYVGGQAAERAIDLGVSEQLSTLMVSAQQYLATAIDDNRTQVRALGEVSAEASSGANPRRLIESLVRELSKATNRATALEANFAEASNELDKIRDSLEQAEERSKTDMLTGLANRRALDEFLRLAQISTMESGSAAQRLPHRHRSFQIVQRQLWTPGRRSGDQAGRRRVA